MINDKFVTDIQPKENTFSKIFADQCTPLKNDIVLPANHMFLTQARLGTLDFNEGGILKIIRALNVNKAHDHDDISIRMIRICDKSLTKPLIILFENSTESSCYPDIYTAQKMKFSITYFFGKCDQIRRKLQIWLVTFSEEICNGKFHFLCSVRKNLISSLSIKRMKKN